MSQKTYQVLLEGQVYAEWTGDAIPIAIATMYMLEQSDLEEELPVIFHNGKGLKDVELRIKPAINKMDLFVAHTIYLECGARYIRYPNGKFRRLENSTGNEYTDKQLSDLYETFSEKILW